MLQMLMDQKRAARKAKLKVSGLALIMAVLWCAAGSGRLSFKERQVWNHVRAAQSCLHQWRTEKGCASEPSDDPWGLGLIGVQWSPITTTLGDLSAKRTACNPAWAIQFMRWFEQIGLAPGDRVSIFTSSSFPGLILNAICAAEAMQLRLQMVVSMGASTWGANHPNCPWPVMEKQLREAGFIRTKADRYTLGGNREMGMGMPVEGRRLLTQSAADQDIEVLKAEDLNEMIAKKIRLLDGFKPNLFINIGGSHANMGDAAPVLSLAPGILKPSQHQDWGTGVIAGALKQGVVTLHLLNLRQLSQRLGIPYDNKPRRSGPVSISGIGCIAGIIVYMGMLLTNKRWEMADPGN